MSSQDLTYRDARDVSVQMKGLIEWIHQTTRDDPGPADPLQRPVAVATMLPLIRAIATLADEIETLKRRES